MLQWAVPRGRSWSGKDPLPTPFWSAFNFCLTRRLARNPLCSLVRNILSNASPSKCRHLHTVADRSRPPDSVGMSYILVSMRSAGSYEDHTPLDGVEDGEDTR